MEAGHVEVVSNALEGPGGEKRGEGAKEMAAFTMQWAVAATPGANQVKGTASKEEKAGSRSERTARSEAENSGHNVREGEGNARMKEGD